MSPVSEAEISDGRIDMMMEYPTRIFIVEFKYEANGKDRSIEALQQIKDNGYAEAYYIKGKVIEGVGISFSKETRNVSAFVTERLYTPQVYPFMKG